MVILDELKKIRLGDLDPIRLCQYPRVRRAGPSPGLAGCLVRVIWCPWIRCPSCPSVTDRRTAVVHDTTVCAQRAADGSTRPRVAVRQCHERLYRVMTA